MHKTYYLTFACYVCILLIVSCQSAQNLSKEKIISLEEKSILSNKMNRAINSLIVLLPEGSQVGISVYNITKDTLLFGYHDKLLSRPASTMKLITSITTLSHPEGTQPFVTDVWYSGDIVGDTLQGDIYIKGCMDPEFDNAAMDSLVARTARFPFKILKGNVIGDLSMKDSLYWGLGWMWDDAPYDYQPHLTPLLFNKGLIKITAIPDSIRQTVIVTGYPKSDYYTILNNTKFNQPEAKDFDVTRDYIRQSNQIIVNGNVIKPCSTNITLSFGQNFFLQTFLERLKKRKKVIGSYRYIYTPPFDYKTSAHLMAIWETDCETVIKRMLKVSDNLNAEAIFYRLAAINSGYPATAKNGVNAIRKLVSQLKLNPDYYHFVDGSGLSNYDCVTPELEVAMLRYAYSNPNIFKILYPSMPIAGGEGSLKNRMKGNATENNVHAKTGSYTGINALAGYLKDKDGDMIAFSIMNQNIFMPKKAQEFQDAICTLLCK